jgi:thymidylate synthase
MTSFANAIRRAEADMISRGQLVHRGKWQGISANKPEMATYELTHYTIKCEMAMQDVYSYRQEIKPNLPWADDAFNERVCGHPLNPGIEWRNWPWGQSADRFRIDPPNNETREKVFDHTYAQRYWPKFAGRTEGGRLDDRVFPYPHRGIYFDYGDLDDVVEELRHDPTTRQAILPVFFPEDTGYRPGRRKPCSLSYHFMLTNNRFDIAYHLRSCDLYHHFRDDIYLTVRLLLWMLNQLRNTISPMWSTVIPGQFVMHIANLHCFVNDYHKLKEGRHDQVQTSQPTSDQRRPVDADEAPPAVRP